MTTVFNELASPAREVVMGNLALSALGKGRETGSFASNRQFTEGDAMANVQAICVWLSSLENRSANLKLLMDDVPEKLRAGMELPFDESMAAWVWEHKRPLVITDQKDAGFPDFARLLLDCGIKYFCAVPLMLANRRIGVLGLTSASPEGLGSFDAEFVQRGMANVGNATKNFSALHHAPETDEDTQEETSLAIDASSDDSFEGLIGRSAAMQAVRKQVKIVAPTGSTVLILGETGTGKELIAQAIHNKSPRSGRPFVKVNCAAIPAGLIESELFGHERGAFTGALNHRVGRFEMANGGTLFLDEIGDVPFDLQPKLLRVLQEQEFERIGSTQTKRVNVRIVAATSRDLPRMVADREFRADLYYRLNVFPLRVPALRERLEDIPLLVRHFMDVYSRKAGKRVTDAPAEALKTLSSHPWPGNVRELQNVIERAVILSTGRVLRPSLDELQPSSQTEDTVGAEPNGHQTTLKDAEREHIIRALAATNWVVGGPAGAAARLGLQRTTLIAKMQKLGITRAQA